MFQPTFLALSPCRRCRHWPCDGRKREESGLHGEWCLLLEQLKQAEIGPKEAWEGLLLQSQASAPPIASSAASRRQRPAAVPLSK